MTSYELNCYDNHKSFYGKAKVIALNNASFVLQSYETQVCKLYWIDGEAYFVRFWGGYSATTMRHVNSFLNHFGFTQYGGKKWWDSLPFETPIKL